MGHDGQGEWPVVVLGDPVVALNRTGGLVGVRQGRQPNGDVSLWNTWQTAETQVPTPPQTRGCGQRPSGWLADRAASGAYPEICGTPRS